MCIAGSSVKCDKWGSPVEKVESSITAAKRTGNRDYITQQQQEIMMDRVSEFFAALDGTFVIRSAVTGEILERDVPETTLLKIQWKNRRSGGRSGSAEVLLLSPTSLVMEMYAMETTVDPHWKYLEGGFLYLIGEPHLFWSMMIHRKLSERGECFPQNSRTQNSWIVSWGMQELERMATPVLHRFVGGGSVGGIANRSRSLSAVLMMQNMEFSQEVLSYSVSPAIPAWWAAVESLWGSALRRVTSKPPCMFFCTPVGCSAGSSCCGSHDEEWKVGVGEVKRRRK